ncbi:MAG: DMT family transporter [Chitinophagaceae bacterium]
MNGLHGHKMVYLKLIGTAMFWGGTFVFTRIAAQTLGPFTGAGLRYSIALVFLIPLAYQQKRQAFKISFKTFPALFLSGFAGVFAYNYFFFKGLKSIPASRGALLAALSPTFVLIISSIIDNEKISFRKLMGILISLFGVIIVISRGQFLKLLSSVEAGDLFMLGCPITWALYTLAGKAALKNHTPLQTTTWASISGLALLALFSFTEPIPSHIPLNVWGSLAYLGIMGTVVAFVWYYDGIRAIGATRAAIFNNLVPVFAVIFSVFILQEKVSWYTWLGGLLVITGVLFVNLPFTQSTDA